MPGSKWKPAGRAVKWRLARGLRGAIMDRMTTYIHYRIPHGDHWGELEENVVHRLSGPPWLPHTRLGTDGTRDDVELLAPATPTKIVCVGLNYRAHVAESKSADQVPDEPVIFLKPLSALIGPGQPIVRPAGVERVDYEAELAVVIGHRLCRPSMAEVKSAIFGATALNDVTARPLQRKDVQWTRAKGFDSFCPVGPTLVSGLDLQNLRIQSFVNGEARQDGNTSDQIFPVTELVKFIADVMTLNAGDLVSTGTPEGVGPLQAGDEVEIRIEHIGSLVNPVADRG